MTTLNLKSKKWAVTASAAFLLAGMIFLGGGQQALARSGSTSGPVMVVLTASWCGSCREITPVAHSAASDAGVKVVTLDVDSANAPDQASAYGITVAGSDLPQVYLYNNGKTTLLFTGRGYHFGQAKQAGQQIRQQLQGGGI